jgi:hypothetical protein
MNRAIAFLAALGLFLGLGSASPRPALAQDDDHAQHRAGSLGFHDIEAPVGVRWWLGAQQKFGIDLGVGFRAEDSNLYDNETLTSWAIDAGVPIVMKSWRRVHVLLRPGLLYESREVELTTPPAPFDKDTDTNLGVSAEIEAEAFLLDNFSVSASTGIGYSHSDPAVGSARSGWGTIGNEFTNIGFHVYLFGKSTP